MTYDQKQINQLSCLIDQNFPAIIKHFGFSLYDGSSYYSGKCPIHPSGNHSSLCYYHNRQKIYPRSRWRCWSYSCNDTFKDTAIGFVRGLLSSQKMGWRQHGDRIYDFKETLCWIEKFFKVDSSKLDIIDVKTPNFYKPSPTLCLTKPEYLDMISDSKYFKSRGFSTELLKFFNVGQPKKPIKKFYFREFVPVFEGENIIGAACRSVFEKCPECECFHDPNQLCPDLLWRGAYPKWKNWVFNRAFSIYNLWNAKQAIKEQNAAILVESPGNTWKLWEAGFKNVIGSYGTKLSWGQIEILRSLGIEKLYLLYDNDDGGESAFVENAKKLWQDFWLSKIIFPKEFNDVGEIEDINVIQDIIGSQYK